MRLQPGYHPVTRTWGMTNKVGTERCLNHIVHDGESRTLCGREIPASGNTRSYSSRWRHNEFEFFRGDDCQRCEKKYEAKVKEG